QEDGVRGWDTNLVKALRDGKDILVHAEGRKDPIHVDIDQMPKGTPARMSQEHLAQIAAWIDLCKRKDAGAVPPPGPVSVTPPPATPNGAAGDWKADDVDFAGVVALIEGLNPKGVAAAPHGKFWGKTRDEFVNFTFDAQTVDAK